MPSTPSDLPSPAKPASTEGPMLPATPASVVPIFSWFRRGAQESTSEAAPPAQQSVEAASAAAANKQAADWHEMRRAAGWDPLKGIKPNTEL